MPAIVEPPNEAELQTTLGPAFPVWLEILHHAEAAFSPLVRTWKVSKTGLGRMCLLQHKKRTLLYLTPDEHQLWVAIILGERAYGIAMASTLPGPIKEMFRDARPYAEGRGIRFAIRSLEDVATVVELLEVKTTAP
jgi:dihydrodipicolinate synthase/N-acetylneuraminate lyase